MRDPHPARTRASRIVLTTLAAAVGGLLILGVVWWSFHSAVVSAGVAALAVLSVVMMWRPTPTAPSHSHEHAAPVAPPDWREHAQHVVNACAEYITNHPNPSAHGHHLDLGGWIVDVAPITVAFNQSRQHAGAVGSHELLANLAGRELAILEELRQEVHDTQRAIQDPDLLKSMFRIDHHCGRLECSISSVAELSGFTQRSSVLGTPERLMDVVRGGIGQVLHYRVATLQTYAGAELLRGDAAHALKLIISHLVDNATKFRSNNTKVEVLFEPDMPKGFGVEVRDYAMPMTRSDREKYNRLLLQADPADINALVTRGKYGLATVANAARRLRMVVQLQGNTVGGTSAMVVIPSELFVKAPQPATFEQDVLDAASTISTAPVELSWQSPAAPSQDHPPLEHDAELPQRRRVPRPHPSPQPDPAPTDSPPPDFDVEVSSNLFNAYLEGVERADSTFDTSGA